MFKRFLFLVLVITSLALSACGPAILPITPTTTASPAPTSTPIKLEAFFRGELGMILFETRSIEIKRGETIQSGITLRSFGAERFSINFVCYSGEKVINFLENSGGIKGIEVKPRIEVRPGAKSCQGNVLVTFWLNDQKKEDLVLGARIYVLE